MATGVLGLGSSGSTGLNQELIDKLKAAERKARVEPIETRISNISSVEKGKEGEQYTLEAIKSKVSSLMGKVDVFDVYNLGSNVFSQVSASSTGSSVAFDAETPSGLEEGTRSVVVGQMAQKDIYQTNSFSSKDAALSAGSFTIKVGAADAQTITITAGMKLSDLATTIENLTGISAGVEQVGENSYRLIVKGEATGTSNALTITDISNGSSQLGLNTAGNKISAAQNLIAKIDGVNYNMASNTITTADGLKINAISVDSGVTITDGAISAFASSSSLTIAKDTTSVKTAITDFVDAYNEVVTIINDELYNAESKMEDTSSLRSILGSLKNMLFDNYGADQPVFGSQKDEYGDTVYKHSNVTNNDKNIFSYGFSFDTNGKLVVDSTELESAIANNSENLKAIFSGSIENAGIGSRFKEYLNEQLNFSTGLLYLYDTNIASRLETLNSEKDKAQTALDDKYSFLSEQFSSYTAIITQMENSFSGLKMMIQQSTSGN